MPNKYSKITNERQYLVSLFVEELNASRGSYKALKAGFIASRMGHIKTRELHQFYKQCERSDNFSKVWWWALRPQKV